MSSAAIIPEVKKPSVGPESDEWDFVVTDQDEDGYPKIIIPLSREKLDYMRYVGGYANYLANMQRRGSCQ